MSVLRSITQGSTQSVPGFPAILGYCSGGVNSREITAVYTYDVI